MQTKFAEPLIGFMNYLNETRKRYWQAFTSAGEVDRLDSQEKTRIADDLGISAEELCYFATQDKDAAELLVRRMESIGLDPRNIDPAVMRDLQRCCSKCTDKVLCIHELEDKPRETTWPRYCPNEQTLGALFEEQQRLPGAT